VTKLLLLNDGCNLESFQEDGTGRRFLKQRAAKLEPIIAVLKIV